MEAAFGLIRHFASVVCEPDAQLVQQGPQAHHCAFRVSVHPRTEIPVACLDRYLLKKHCHYNQDSAIGTLRHLDMRLHDPRPAVSHPERERGGFGRVVAPYGQLARLVSTKRKGRRRPRSSNVCRYGSRPRPECPDGCDRGRRSVLLIARPARHKRAGRAMGHVVGFMPGVVTGIVSRRLPGAWWVSGASCRA
ncbi:DUF6000 family protein [Actinoallomurus iriomotensis]|uniref:DUF6000 family protein n=1 Tax=Actinoallomurus iriomotensis TaxID=478107 RepID=UPI003D7F80A5